ncbi:MAG: hypothetical protein WC788_00955 [Candidatus Paceibacterota bacterium]|jgi:hypothetical protein
MRNKSIKLLVKIFIIVLLPGSFAVKISDAQEDRVNISASVPSGEVANPGGGAPIIDSDPPQIFAVEIDDISFTGADIRWRTNENSSAYLYYGKTLSYEIGVLEDHAESLVSSHRIEIRDLGGNTVYYFQIRSTDSAGNQGIKDGYSFKTLSEKISPENVSGLKAIAGDSKIALSWNNPFGQDFDKLVIQRSEIFYPKNTSEGLEIYSGKERSFVDEDLINGTRYYYTVFSFDEFNDISSGAVASAIPDKPAAEKPELLPEKPEGPPEIPPEIRPEFPPGEPLLPPETLPDIEKITIDDFNFIQDGSTIKLEGGRIEIDQGKEIVVVVDSTNIPKEIGSIMIILTRENEEYSYLMKKDEQGGGYSASIKLSEEGSFDITIVLLDKENRIIKALNGSLSPTITTKPPESRFSPTNYIFPLIIFILIIILYKIIKRLPRDRKKQKNKMDGGVV